MREQFDVHPDTLSGHGAAVVALAPELEGVESEVRAQRLSPAQGFQGGGLVTGLSRMALIIQILR